MGKAFDLEKARVSEPKCRVDEVKRDVCEILMRIASREQWRNKDMAIFLDTSEATICRINRHRFHQISLDTLFVYLERLRPGFRLLISP